MSRNKNKQLDKKRDTSNSTEALYSQRKVENFIYMYIYLYILNKNWPVKERHSNTSSLVRETVANKARILLNLPHPISNDFTLLFTKQMYLYFVYIINVT